MLALPMVILGLSALPFGRVGIAQELKFTEEYLTDPKNIELGRTVWEKRCKFCHGRAGYPGKAPKLQPSRYKPEFVYDRVTNGFQGMPAWKEEFSEKERKAVVSYVMSKVFSR
ncbi:MAG: c-type cytochrome [Rhodothermales bacterium]